MFAPVPDYPTKSASSAEMTSRKGYLGVSPWKGHPFGWCPIRKTTPLDFGSCDTEGSPSWTTCSPFEG
jgi:hypothetical protein